MMCAVSNSDQARPSRRRWSLWRYAHLILPVVFFGLMFVYFPFRERFEFDQDEGYEAMKAFMVVRGYRLYSEIWSDQPPLFTYLLAACIRLSGPDINAARTLVLVFSTALMAASAHYLRTEWGLPHALAGSLLVFLLPFYNTLSVSVMQAVPVLTFTLLSLLALSAWHQNQRDRWLVLSALALALSILTKLFIGYLAPIFVLGILFDARARLYRNASWLKALRPAILWCLVFLVPSGGMSLLMIGSSWSNFSQLLDTHLVASQSRTYVVSANASPINFYLSEAWPILLLAIPGCLFILLERRWTSAYLFTWLAVAYLMLSVIVPVRYHYQLLVTIPAALLAAIATGEGLRRLVQGIRSHTFFNGRFALAIIALVAFLVVLYVRYPLVQPSFDRLPVFVTHGDHAPWPDQVFLTKMTNHAPKTRWIVTDLPLYAFRVGLPVPPYLVVASTKRFVTGALSEEDLMNFVREYNPEQVLTGNGVYPNLEAFLENDYRLLYSRGKRQLYLRKDLKGQ